jgi:leucyl aminopeptidase
VTTISLSNESAGSLPADAVVIGVAASKRGLVLTAGAQDVDRALRGRLAEVLAALGATGKAEQVTKIPSLGATKAPVILAVGLGDAPSRRTAHESAYESEPLRRAAGAAARALAGTSSVGLALPAESVEQLAAVSEGALLGAYTFLRYRTAPAEGQQPPVRSFTLATPLRRDRTARAAVERAQIVAEAVHLARDLVNTPAADLRPADFAAAAVSAGQDAGVDVEVLDEKALKKGGYGGILGVGQGSVSPPRLVRMAWRRPEAAQHVALVGKGITFDSGGLSLKPAEGMITMKCDMGGAAAVIAATRAIARLGLPVNVTTWAPMAENMPSGTAQRPSDVLTTYGGKTVEVLNTDAEGRLILADALARASEESPDLLLDVATLTGAAMVALGHRTSAIMANDEELQRHVHDAARRAGELMWPMPLPEELRKGLDSAVADLANVGERWGGALTAGLFLREFVGGDIKWAHLDIAGPAFNDSEPYGYTPKGGTGAAVRTLVRLAEDVAEDVASARR